MLLFVFREYPEDLINLELMLGRLGGGSDPHLSTYRQRAGLTVHALGEGGGGYCSVGFRA